MFVGIRRVALTAACAVALGAVAASGAQASVLSVLPGSCGSQTESQPFAAYGDNAHYTLVPGGDFQSGSVPWTTSGGASAGGGQMSLPSGSSALSPATCTSIYQPTVRLFVRNTGAASSHLTVQALYPGLLGSTQTVTIGQLTGSSAWSPSPILSIQSQDLLATLSLSQTSIALRFVPADGSGDWSITGVYLDPYGRN